MIESCSPHAPEDLVVEAPVAGAGEMAKALIRVRAAQAGRGRGPAAMRAQALADATLAYAGYEEATVIMEGR